MINRNLLTCLTLVMASCATLAVTPKLSIGYDHMLLLKSDGTVWSWGNNASGQLGVGSTSASNTPVQVTGLIGVVDVVARQGGLSMALKADGTVWVWGNNSGDLIGTTTSGGVFNNTPTLVSGLNSMVSIAAAFDGFTAFATDTNGKVWSWGSNNNGELGDGTTNRHSAPTAIAGLDNVVQVVATSDQVAALRKDGTVFSWGYNNSADSLRVGNSLGTYAKASLASVPALTTLGASNSNTSGLFWGVDLQGRAMAWGDTNSGLLTCNQDTGSTSTGSLAQPYFPLGLTQVKQVEGGGTYALFLNNTGSVVGCGYNADGELGDGTTKSTTTGSSPAKFGPVATVGLPSNVAFVAAGGYASAAILGDGGVFTWGRAGGGLAGVIAQSAINNTQPVALSINAGAGATAPATFAGTQTGALASTTLSVGIAVAPLHVGQTGEVYLVVVLPTAQILTLNSAGVLIPYDSTRPIEPLARGALPARLPLQLASNVNLTGFAGTTVIIGYGLGSGSAANADLLSSNSRYSGVLTLR